MDKFIARISKIDKTRWYLPAVMFVLGTFLLTYRLGQTPKGLSIPELTTRNGLITHIYNIQFLIHNLWAILFYGYFVILNYLDLHNLFAIRLIGYLCGITAIIMFYYIAKTFTNKFIGIVSTALFSTNLWFLQIVRNSQILQFYSFAIFVAIGLAILYYRKKDLKWLALAGAVFLGLSLYIPGMIWFNLLFIAVNFNTLRLETKLLPRNLKLSLLIIFLLLLAPIVYESLSNHSVIYSTLFIPRNIYWHQVLCQFIDYPKYLFFQNNASLQYSIGRLPLINFASSILVIFSGFWLVKNWKNPIVQYIYLSIGLDWLLSSISGYKTIYIILPLISLLIPLGIFYLYKEWKRVFPKNPYPDVAARILIGVLVTTICIYNILLYFIVWPNTTNTIHIYSLFIR